MIVPQIFSQGFEAMVEGKADITQTKVYCSEMLLLALLKLIKKNNLDKN